MPPAIKQYIQKLNAYWSNRTMSQRILLAGLTVSVSLAFVLMIYWLNRPDYRVLYSKLYPEDASKIVSMLKGSKDPYELQDNGQTILVPADRVYDLRLKIAGEGSIKGNGLGFEIFDDVKIGQTDFVQRINYQRALQGELSRTISEFPEVERARVHLVLPHKSLFIEEQAPATASVVVTTKQGQELNKVQTKAIVNLIALAVEGLDKSQITISDTTGKLLYQADAENSVEGLTLGQLEYRNTLQKNVEQKIEQLLLPIVGQGKAIARVNADVDFSTRTITRQSFDPASAVVRSEQRSEEQNKGTANIEGGNPDPNFRGDGPNGSLSSQDGTRETRTTNFEINKEEQSIVVPVGEVKRLSVAVVVDGVWETPAAGGAAVFAPRKAEELERIKQLVRNAVGFDEARGDTIEIASHSFGQPDVYQEPGVLQIMMEHLARIGKPVVNALLVLLFMVLIVRPVVLTLIKPRVDNGEVEELMSLPQSSERLALEEGVEEEVLDLNRRLELAKAQALQLSEKDMDQAVAVLKNWLKQPVEAA